MKTSPRWPHVPRLALSIGAEVTHPMSDSEHVQCSVHGDAYQTFIGKHLAEHPAQTWYSMAPDPQNNGRVRGALWAMPHFCVSINGMQTKKRSLRLSCSAIAATKRAVHLGRASSSQTVKSLTSSAPSKLKLRHYPSVVQCVAKRRCGGRP